MKINRLKLIFGAGTAALLVALFAAGWGLFGWAGVTPCRDFSQGVLWVGQEPSTISLALARTEAERISGLLGCERLSARSGMYFAYTTPVTPRFWMRGMLIPLDLVWIRDGVVIGVEENVPPADAAATHPAIYQPASAVDGVLEVAAGGAAQYGLVPGTSVRLEIRN